jgi:hypothetical protein
MRGAFIRAVPRQESEPRPAMTENGRLCRGDRGHGRGHRRRRALMLAILSDVARYRVASALEMAKATFRAVFASDRPVSMNRPPTP